MEIRKIFDAFNDLKVLIVGDVMIDAYLWGSVSRISPEAPVPIVNAVRRENRLGGAANVARNIHALGATPILCAVVGNDAESEIFDQLLAQNQMTSAGIVKSDTRITTIKQRVLAGSQHLMRIDAEMDNPINEQESQTLLGRIKELLPEVDVIIFEDYDKGVLTPWLIGQVIGLAKAQNIPTVVDPKKRNFLAYQGCTLFKPNLKELREGLNISIKESQLVEDLRKATQQLKAVMPIGAAMITLSENGVYITDFEAEYHIGAHRREIADVSGAGDTVVSIAACCLALGVALEQVANIANLGGGLVCEHLGVVPINKEQLRKEAHRIYHLS